MTIKWVSFEGTCVCGFKSSVPKDLAQHVRECKMFSGMSEAARNRVKDWLWSADDA